MLQNKLLNKYYLVNIIKYLLNIVPNFIIKCEIVRDEIIIYSINEKLLPLLYFLKNHMHTQLKIVTDITVIDYPKKKNRFIIVYNLLSTIYNIRVRLKIKINEIIPVTSVNILFAGANWYEREIWDMFGIFFYNSIDLRRILTDYGFKGYPLRKEFPLTGYVEVRYDQNKRKIVFEPIELSQEFRNFDFIKPWNYFIK